MNDDDHHDHYDDVVATFLPDVNDYAAADDDHDHNHHHQRYIGGIQQ